MTSAVRSIGRFREIISTLARNGLRELILKTNLHEHVPGFVLPDTKIRLQEMLAVRPNQSWAAVLGLILRTSFEELGPGFVKLGQLIATREDLLDIDLINELRPLQDHARGIEFYEAKEIIEKALGGPTTNFFKNIDEKPLGMASIGVVFSATLNDGQNVVIKVRRPGIAKIIERDIELFSMLITQLEKVSSEIKLIGLSRVLENFAQHLSLELDYRIESLNLKRMAAAFDRENTSQILRIPKIQDELTREEILVMERVEGIQFNNTSAIRDKIQDLKPRIEESVKIFAKTLLCHGLFHADLHGGNLFLQTDQKIALIDFGLIGSLSQSSRRHLVTMLHSLISGHEERLVAEFLEVAEYDKPPDTLALTRDVRDCLRPFVGLTVNQMDIGKIFKSIVTTLTKHKIYLPRDWFLVFRALITLDGLGKSLGIDFDLLQLLHEDVKKIFSNLFSKDQMIEEMTFFAHDALTATNGLPRHLKWFLRDFAKRGYRIEINQTGYEKSLLFLGRSFISSALLFLSGIFALTSFWAYLERSKEIITSTIPQWFFAIMSIIFIILSGLNWRKSK